MLVFAAVLVLLAVVLLVVGVLTRDEPGLKYPEASWSKEAFPLLVEVDAYAGVSPEEVKKARTAVSEAVKITNDQLGFEAFKVVGLVAHSHVFVQIGVPQQVGQEPIDGVIVESAGGAALLSGEENQGAKHWTGCFVQTSNTVDLLEQVLRHELGHCLGLAHDEHQGSIMYPVQRGHNFLPSITDHDREILRNRYAP